jgi:TolB protein
VANVWRVPILTERAATWADAEQLTYDEAFIELIDLSPDGERVAVSSDRSGNQDLWILPAEGGNMEQLTTEPTGDWSPKWSPDGSEIAFYSNRGGSRDVWVMPAEGGAARQVTRLEGAAMLAGWSPDGETLAFQWTDQMGNTDIWFVPATGGEPRRVTTHAAVDAWASWSPDGQWLIVASNRNGEWWLWRMTPSAEEDELEPLVAIDLYGMTTRWSPDGRHIYITRDVADFYAYAVADGTERRVTDFSGRRGQLGWVAAATDGHYLYFTWEEDLGDIWVMDVVTEESE